MPVELPGRRAFLKEGSFKDSYKGLIRSFLKEGSFKDSYKVLIRVPGGFEEGRASLTAHERKSSQSLEAYSVMNMATYSPYVMETYPI